MSNSNTTNNNLVQNYSKQAAAKDAQLKLLSTFNGVLSTVMRDTLDIEGYPFGSVVPFCLNDKNQIILLISDIAQHTKNIKENPKTSLTLHNTDQDNIQKGWRLTIAGDVTLAPDSEVDAIAARYERHFPESAKYHRVHDFKFYLLTPKKCRYINGFGEIHWVDYDMILAPTPFDSATEARIINHMNEDHQDALLLFLETRINITKPEKVRMTHVDQYGFTVAHDETMVRFSFDKEATSPTDIRVFLVDMVNNVRAA